MIKHSFKSSFQTIRDRQLFVMLLILVLIDVVILLIWQIIDPLVLIEKEKHDHVKYSSDTPSFLLSDFKPHVKSPL